MGTQLVRDVFALPTECAAILKRGGPGEAGAKRSHTVSEGAQADVSLNQLSLQ